MPTTHTYAGRRYHRHHTYASAAAQAAAPPQKSSPTARSVSTKNVRPQTPPTWAQCEGTTTQGKEKGENPPPTRDAKTQGRPVILYGAQSKYHGFGSAPTPTTPVNASGIRGFGRAWRINLEYHSWHQRSGFCVAKKIVQLVSTTYMNP